MYFCIYFYSPKLLEVLKDSKEPVALKLDAEKGVLVECSQDQLWVW